MLDNYVASLKQNEKPEVAQSLVDLYVSSKKLDDLIATAIKGTPLKLSQIRLALTSILTDVEDAQAQLKVYRTNEDTRELVPSGISSLLNRVLRVTTEIANATIFADKGDRLSQRELVQSYHDSFPFDDIKQAIESHIVSVRSRRTSQKMGSDVTADRAIGDLARSYSKSYNKLPTSLKGLPFTAFHMPITPLFKDIGVQIDPSKLERAGFKVTRVGDGYIVLENQSMIAFDHKELGIDSGVRKTKRGYKIAKLSGPKRELAHTAANDKLIELIETINSRSHVRYSLASSQFVPNPRNPKMWLAWIVTDAQRKALAQTLNTIEVEWGLPFSLNEDE